MKKITSTMILSFIAFFPIAALAKDVFILGSLFGDSKATVTYRVCTVSDDENTPASCGKENTIDFPSPTPIKISDQEGLQILNIHQDASPSFGTPASDIKTSTDCAVGFDNTYNVIKIELLQDGNNNRVICIYGNA